MKTRERSLDLRLYYAGLTIAVLFALLFPLLISAQTAAE